ncbi:MAG: Fic family protein [Methanomassiliicoccaceae archaeon]|nr:Fic family protein [Methanomassiliicoccaceae archaeon]
MNRPPFEINDKIINMLAEIMNKLGRSDAITNKRMDLYLRKASMVRTINSSCAIEANTLTEKQVEAIIEGKRVIAPPDEIIEIRNAYDAYVRMNEFDPYDIDSFLKAHGILMKQLIKNAGEFRTTGVNVYENGDIVHVGARPQFIYSMIYDLFEWGRTSEVNPIIKACVLHYEIETIHPFSDGNGRIGRLWQSVILCGYNELFKLMPIETLVYENQERYYRSIEASRKARSSTAFIEFMMEMILGTIDEFNGDVHGPHGIKEEYLRDLNKNEKKMLGLIIKNYDADGGIAAGRLNEMTESADSTVRNHLKKFTEKGILIASGENKGRRYVLNKDVLS